MICSALSLLGGCSALPSSINPVEWWHGLQGGAIAEQRPPPPGADQAYPNLASVPEKPKSADLKMQKQIADSLVADRTNAHYAATTAPLPDPSSPTASPALFGRGTVPPPAPPTASDTAGASLAAATAPPAPPAAAPAAPPPLPTAAARPSAPGKAPVASVQTAPLAPPPGADVAGPAPPDAGPRPGFAAAPPPPPSIAGAPASASAVTPATPPTAPKPAATSAEPKQVGATVPIGFEPGSAVLPRTSRDALKQLALRRQKATVLVTGFGEAASPDPTAQSGALTLALSRAQAMAAALTAAGVPGASIRADGEASGRGGAVRLVE